MRDFCESDMDKVRHKACARHSWTGNRVTCRDWFQLTLKEGLTVFRDQARGRPHPMCGAGCH